MGIKSLVILGVLFSNLCYADLLTPEMVLSEAYKSNPALAAVKATADAEKELISSEYSLSSPRLGFMRETDMSFMQMEDGPMKTWSISQEFLFPTKYFSRGSIQEAKAVTGS